MRRSFQKCWLSLLLFPPSPLCSLLTWILVFPVQLVVADCFADTLAIVFFTSPDTIIWLSLWSRQWAGPSDSINNYLVTSELWSLDCWHYSLYSVLIKANTPCNGNVSDAEHESLLGFESKAVGSTSTPYSQLCTFHCQIPQDSLELFVLCQKWDPLSF